MRVAVLGGGPGGLYFASLWKARHPRDWVQLFEQNPADATWGFGVVFSERALEFLREDDPDTVDLISPQMEAWHDITLVHRGERIVIDGIGFSAIGRLELLQLLQGQARAAGVVCSFERPIREIDELAGFDLVVAADGVHSLVRRSFEADLGFSLSYLTNKFIWSGTARSFDTLTQTFVETGAGTFNAHHYRYAPTMSTFLVECDRSTWLRAGFDKMPEEETARTRGRSGTRQGARSRSARRADCAHEVRDNTPPRCREACGSLSAVRPVVRALRRAHAARAARAGHELHYPLATD